MQMINDEDVELIKCFVVREIFDFTKSEPLVLENIKKYMKRIDDKLGLYATQGVKVDFIVFTSMSNLGQVIRELRVTPANGYWDFKRMLYVRFPPSLLSMRGAINFSLKTKKDL